MRLDARKSTLALAIVASAVLSWIVWQRRTRSEPIVVANVSALEQVAAERDLGPEAAGEPPLWRYWLSEQHARKIFAFPDGRRYDPWVYFVDRPNRSDRVKWPEHSGGFYTYKTNSQGYRDDEPGPPADWEVLVVGDSNTAGVCNVEENFSNRLEALLREARPEETVSVTNLGTGGFGPFSYLGAVERSLANPPDVFVVALFGGNDFAEVLPLNRILSGGPEVPWNDPAVREVNVKRMTALEDEILLMTHGFNSELIFKTFPDRERTAIDVTLRLVTEMKAACDSVGTRLVLLYIPPPIHFDWPNPLAGSEELRTFLGFGPEDGQSSSRMADAVLAGARELGLAVVDLRPVLGALPEPPYWRRDLHMNVEAHDLTAHALLEACR